ncbi:MAG TPA: hypothetical protein VGP88_06965 [Thermoplasmata archaeon]|nr:hypothetical protein [Thermoplasmata archaeon]
MLAGPPLGAEGEAAGPVAGDADEIDASSAVAARGIGTSSPPITRNPGSLLGNGVGSPAAVGSHAVSGTGPTSSTGSVPTSSGCQ